MHLNMQKLWSLFLDTILHFRMRKQTIKKTVDLRKKAELPVLLFIYCRGVKLSSWRATALHSLDATLIKHTWSS